MESLKFIKKYCGDEMAYLVVDELTTLYKTLEPKQIIYYYFDELAADIDNDFISSSLLWDLFDEMFDYEYPDD